MKEKTLIKKRNEMKQSLLVNCHGGKGSIDWTEVMTREKDSSENVKFIHDDIIPPGASVGIHRHEDDEEYYYIVSGKGIMTLDEEQFEVKTGDLTVVFPGGRHGLENQFEDDLRVIVFCVNRF